MTGTKYLLTTFLDIMPNAANQDEEARIPDLLGQNICYLSLLHQNKLQQSVVRLISLLLQGELSGMVEQWQLIMIGKNAKNAIILTLADRPIAIVWKIIYGGI